MISKVIGKPIESIDAQIRGILKEKMDINDDGSYFQNGKEKLRTLDDKKAMATIKTADLNSLMVHFRAASAGVVSEENVHGWEIGDWTFFHNGGSSDYYDFNVRSEQKTSDSYEFFQDLWLTLEQKEITKDKQVVKCIEDLLKKVQFWGRAALYNSKLDKMYLFGDFQIYSVASYLVISSSSIKWDADAVLDVHGINFKYPTIAQVGEFETEGIWVMDNFSKPDFKFKQLTEELPKKVWVSDYKGADSENYYQPDFKFGDNWRQEGRNWVKIPEKTKSKEEKKLDKELSADKQDIIDNINRVLEDAPDYTAPYTEKQLEDLLTDETFIGWDKRGVEIFMDMYGFHYADRSCCEEDACFDMATGIVDVWKEEVMEKVK